MHDIRMDKLEDLEGEDIEKLRERERERDKGRASNSLDIGICFDTLNICLQIQLIIIIIIINNNSHIIGTERAHVDRCNGTLPVHFNVMDNNSQSTTRCY